MMMLSCQNLAFCQNCSNNMFGLKLIRINSNQTEVIKYVLVDAISGIETELAEISDISIDLNNSGIINGEYFYQKQIGSFPIDITELIFLDLTSGIENRRFTLPPFNGAYRNLETNGCSNNIFGLKLIRANSNQTEVIKYVSVDAISGIETELAEISDISIDLNNSGIVNGEYFYQKQIGSFPIDITELIFLDLTSGIENRRFTLSPFNGAYRNLETNACSNNIFGLKLIRTNSNQTEVIKYVSIDAISGIETELAEISDISIDLNNSGIINGEYFYQKQIGSFPIDITELIFLDLTSGMENRRFTLSPFNGAYRNIELSCDCKNQTLPSVIPTIKEWGVVLILLLLMITGTIKIRKIKNWRTQINNN